MDNRRLPNLPTQITSLDGQTVNTSNKVWRIRAARNRGAPFTLKWSTVASLVIDEGSPVFGKRAIRLMRLYIADCLQRRKPSTCFIYFSSFLKFGRWLQTQPEWVIIVCVPNAFEWQHYNEALARAFHTWGVLNTASKGDFFRHLRIFYRWGVTHRYSDFSLETVRVLDAIKPQMHPVGQHVRFRHPTEGPFSAAEKQLIVQAIQARQGSIQQRILVMLLLELGVRPLAAVQLYNSDLHVFTSSQATFFQLDVPRLKQRHAYRETRRRPLSSQLGTLLLQTQQGESDDPLLYWLGDQNPAERLRSRVQQWVNNSGLLSPRTGKPLKCNPRRFRYTLATHFAAEGASRFHIASLLDHSDLNYVDVYAATTPAISQTVADATDTALQPLVNRFLGKVIATPTTDAVVPAMSPHIPLPVLNIGGIGQCGRDSQKHGLCQLFPPLSCYQCPSFLAWRDGPHRELHDNLQSFISASDSGADTRIRLQLTQTTTAIAGLLQQLEVEQ